MEEIVREVVPRFFSVALCVGDVCPTVMLLHDNDVGETETPGGTTVPVPVTEADVGTFVALFATLTVPERSPTTVGENSTVTVQLLLGASVLGLIGQFDVAIKSFVDVETDEIAIGRKYWFTSVNVCFALVSPSWTLPKFWLVGLSASAAAFGLFRWKPHPVENPRMQKRSSTEDKDRGPGKKAGTFVAALSAPRGIPSKTRFSDRSIRLPP
jgi:hypothetical protein